MNNLYRTELEELKRQQSLIEGRLSSMQELRAEVTALKEAIARLEVKLNAVATAEAAERAPGTGGERVLAVPEPSPRIGSPEFSDPQRPHAAPASSATRPLGESGRRMTPPPPPLESVIAGGVAPEKPLANPETAASGEKPADGRGSFEMRLGTYWLVRVGIVMLLTAMVFFGRYAYQNFIGQLGPAGKVALLYLTSGLLLGLGSWFQRKEEALRRYGEVLFAGGLAAVYFTTFAAHYVPNLRVISSPLLAGVLLLAWAGVMVWLANRRESEVLALFAIGLAYYSSAITRIEWFTLFSNFILTVAVVIFLVRNRWAALSAIGLVATYSSYGYWRFYSVEGWGIETELALRTVQMGIAFLAAYWIAFTAAAFVSKSEKLAGTTRVTFATLNNVAFFGLALLTMAHVSQGGFWKVSLGFGVVLVGLAAVARRSFPDEPVVESAYLTQGLLLVTIGFIAKFSGMQLALVLSAQSVLLLFLGDRLDRRLLRIGSYGVAALAAASGISAFGTATPPGILLGIALGAFMLANTWQAAHRETESGEIRPRTTYFSFLALLLWFVTTWNQTSVEYRPAVLALEAVLFTFSIYALRISEVTILGQLYLLSGQAVWLHGAIWNGTPHPSWVTALVIAITLGLSHWWQRQRTIQMERSLPIVWQSLFALALVGVLDVWLKSLVSQPVWIALTSILAIAMTLYAAVTRAWILGIAGQLFLAVSTWEFASQILSGHPQWYWTVLPIATLSFLSWLGAVVLPKVLSAHPPERTDANPQYSPLGDAATRQTGESLQEISMVYRWTALVMTLVWTHEYLPERERCWFLILLGFLVFMWTLWSEVRERMLFSAVLSAAGLFSFWTLGNDGPIIYMPNALAILAFLAQQQLARRLPKEFDLPPGSHNAMIVAGGVSLWWFISQWVSLKSGGFYLTVSWTLVALALFLTGLFLRERMYRWLGLGVLAIALARVVLIDVWKLEQVYRIFSFMALGVVLLLLGFLYNKFQEKIREWL